jgi:death-on-curing family protein
MASGRDGFFNRAARTARCRLASIGFGETASIAAYGKNPDVIELAAAYTVGILRNHPFIDVDRRFGFVLGVLFLEMNGHRLAASEEDATPPH